MGRACHDVMSAHVTAEVIGNFMYAYYFVPVILVFWWVVNLTRAFCDPRPRSYQIMSAAQHLALINTIRTDEFARELLIKDIILIEYNTLKK
jgi:hypothetical protein